MKNYKKLFICALSTLFVGAGISGLAKLDDSSYVASAALSVTDIAESDVKDATLKTVVASKIKQLDQATPDDGTVNGNANGYFTKEGGTPRYVSAKYNDWNVEALYFSRDEDWTTYTDAQQNSGWSEFRFDYSGEVIGFSFDYTLSGTVGWSTELSGRANGTTDLGVSEELGSYCFQYKGADGKYYNVENQEALIADGAWHRYTYVGSGDITNILIKLYHFQGEMLFSNLTIYTQEEATATGKTPIATLPESTIALEEAKIKNMHVHSARLRIRHLSSYVLSVRLLLRHSIPIRQNLNSTARSMQLEPNASSRAPALSASAQAAALSAAPKSSVCMTNPAA